MQRFRPFTAIAGACFILVSLFFSPAVFAEEVEPERAFLMSTGSGTVHLDFPAAGKINETLFLYGRINPARMTDISEPDAHIYNEYSKQKGIATHTDISLLFQVNWLIFGAVFSANHNYSLAPIPRVVRDGYWPAYLWLDSQGLISGELRSYMLQGVHMSEPIHGELGFAVGVSMPPSYTFRPFILLQFNQVGDSGKAVSAGFFLKIGGPFDLRINYIAGASELHFIRAYDFVLASDSTYRYSGWQIGITARM